MPHARSLQLRIALAFLGLIVGFVGAVLYVPLALWPVAQRAESIQTHRAEAVRTLGEVRGAARELRSAALLTYQAQWDESLTRDDGERAVGVARDRIRSRTAEYLRLPRPRPPEIERVWRQLADVDFPALDAAVDGAVAASRRPGGDPIAVRRILAAGASVDRDLQHLADMNAEAAQGDAERIHGRIRRLAIGYVILAAVGAAGALVLLLQALTLLRGYTHAAERRVAELEAFAGQVSHDLRSPLQTIQLAVTSIERKAQDESLQRLASRAAGSVRRLDAMIRDLLQFARSGGTAQEGVRADVGAVLQDVGDELQPVAQRAGVTLTVAGEPGVHARIAGVALKTIVANLVENAIKYRRPDGGGRVDVSAKADRERVVVAVKDDGIGISPGIIPRLFDPFFRGTKRPDSYGLGLATVKRLVESHQGTISVDSEEGRGSVFSVGFGIAESPNDSQDRVGLSVDAPNAADSALAHGGEPHSPLH
ncbi:MAG: sensor histidine kinase [Anaeromyxobacteraceae bacterium]